MEWLTQNWIWLVLGIGAAFLFSRSVRGGHGGHGGCCGGAGHGESGKRGEHGSTSPKDAVNSTAGHQHH